jgi:hypothetical protein
LSSLTPVARVQYLQVLFTWFAIPLAWRARNLDCFGCGESLDRRPTPAPLSKIRMRRRHSQQMESLLTDAKWQQPTA